MATQWNLFAAELLTILQTQDPTADLDLLGYRANLHPQKIQRLKDSLEYQRQFPVLNETELASVVQAFGLADQELRLRAAILATGIEAKLLPRIGTRAALQAARALLPIIHQALIDAEDDGESPLNQIRQEGVLTMSPLTQRFAEALALIDRGTLALYQAVATDVEERQESLRQAHADFSRALEVLEARAGNDDTIRQDAIWQAWRAEAQAGLTQAQA